MPSCFRNSRVVRRRNPVRLWSCALESRIAPATFIVDDLSDDFALLNNPAPGTLRYAVNQTNRNDGADQIIIIRMGHLTESQYVLRAMTGKKQKTPHFAGFLSKVRRPG